LRGKAQSVLQRARRVEGDPFLRAPEARQCEEFVAPLAQDLNEVLARTGDARGLAAAGGGGGAAEEEAAMARAVYACLLAGRRAAERAAAAAARMALFLSFFQ
jgi:hypothetical protein